MRQLWSQIFTAIQGRIVLLRGPPCLLSSQWFEWECSSGTIQCDEGQGDVTLLVLECARKSVMPNNRSQPKQLLASFVSPQYTDSKGLKRARACLPRRLPQSNSWFPPHIVETCSFQWCGYGGAQRISLDVNLTVYLSLAVFQVGSAWIPAAWPIFE